MSTTQELIAADHQYILQVYSRPDFVIARGEGCYLYDTEGRRYLDLVAGIAVNALGYGDKDVAAAIRNHADGLLHLSNLYHNTQAASLAKLLVESCTSVDRVFLCNSGTEANEGAIKYSRRYALDTHGTGKHVIVAFNGSFHGRSIGAVSITGREKYRQPFEPVMPGVRFVDFNDTAAAVEAIREDVCAVFIEPIQGEGGLSVASTEFLRAVRERCDAVDALLVYDEIQCGMGRSGALWAHPSSAPPDIMTVAKPLGGGLPIGAILMREKVAAKIHPGDHGSTFAGGPFVTAVAQTVFKKIADPVFLEHVRSVSDYLDESLAELASHTSRVIELRGRGLMRGIQIDGAAGPVREAGHANGLLIATAGDDVLRLVPPLVLTNQHVDEAVEKLALLLK